MEHLLVSLTLLTYALSLGAYTRYLYTGAGLGASHQTGWTGLVANLIDEWCQTK